MREFSSALLTYVRRNFYPLFFFCRRVHTIIYRMGVYPGNGGRIAGIFSEMVFLGSQKTGKIVLDVVKLELKHLFSSGAEPISVDPGEMICLDFPEYLSASFTTLGNNSPHCLAKVLLFLCSR